jgi:hypothetical protein
MPLIGILMSGAEGDPEARADQGAFVHQLNEFGWTNGRNVHIDTSVGDGGSWTDAD